MWSWDKKCDVSELSSAFIRSDVYIISDTKKKGEISHAQNIVTTSVFIEWRAASSLGAISSPDQLQWVRTTRTCSPGHWPSGRRGFLCQVSRLASDYYTPPEFSSFSWPVNRWQLRNNRLVTNDGNNIKRETQAGREPSEAFICETRNSVR